MKIRLSLIGNPLDLSRKLDCDYVGYDWYRNFWRPNRYLLFDTPKQIHNDRQAYQKSLASEKRKISNKIDFKFKSSKAAQNVSFNKYGDSHLFHKKKIVKRYSYFDGLGVCTATKVDKVPLNLWKPVRKDRKGFLVFDKSFLSRLPITGSKSKYLGRYPLRMGAIPGKFSKSEPLSRVFNNDEDFCPKFMHGKYNLDNWIRVSGSWHTNWHQLQSMSEDTQRRPGTRRFEQILYNEVPKLKLPQLEAPTLADLYSGQVNLDAQCGGDFKPLNTKSDNLATILDAASKLFDKVHRHDDGGNSLLLDQSVYSVGAREKKQKDVKQGELLKSRLVLNQDAVAAAFCKAYTSKIEHFFKNCDSYYKEQGVHNPFYIGHSHAHLGWLRYNADIVDAENCFEGDWEEFDTCAHESLIAAAFSMARSMFPASDEIDRAFFFMYSGFVAKHVVTPDGLLYRIDKGIPSGNMWTSIIGTFVNYILLTEMFTRYAVFRLEKINFRLLVCGDDFVVSVLDKNKINFNPKKLRRWTKFRTGFKIKADYKYGPPVCEHDEDSITFLKLCIHDINKPTTRWTDLVSRILLPNRKIDLTKDVKELLNFLCAQKQCLPNSNKSKVFLSRYLSYIYYYLTYNEIPNRKDKNSMSIYIDWVKNVRREISFLVKKIYMDFKVDDYYFESELKATSTTRWSYYNSKYKFDEKYNKVNLLPNKIFIENWYYENLPNMRKPDNASRKKYFEAIVGKSNYKVLSKINF